MTDLQLPAWVEYVKALGAPAVALVAACVAGGIAYRQWRTARNKLKLDFFDKRMEVYNAAVTLVHEVTVFDPITLDRIGELATKFAPAQWLFGPEVAIHLTALRTEAVRRRELQIQQKCVIEDAPPTVDADELSGAQKLLLEDRVTFRLDCMRELDRIVSTYLKLEH